MLRKQLQNLKENMFVCMEKLIRDGKRVRRERERERVCVCAREREREIRL